MIKILSGATLAISLASNALAQEERPLSILLGPTIVQGQVLPTDYASPSSTRCTVVIAMFDDAKLLSPNALVYFEGYLEAIRDVASPSSTMAVVAREFRTVCVSKSYSTVTQVGREVISNLTSD